MSPWTSSPLLANPSQFGHCPKPQHARGRRRESDSVTVVHTPNKEAHYIGAVHTRRGGTFPRTCVINSVRTAGYSPRSACGREDRRAMLDDSRLAPPESKCQCRRTHCPSSTTLHRLAAGAERPRSDRGGPGATGSRAPEPIPDALRRQHPGKSPGTGRSRRTPVHWPRSIWSSPIPRSLRCSIEFGNGTLRRISPQRGQPEFRAEIGAGRSTAQAVWRESERNPPRASRRLG
jgi:hypothetical protein